MRFCEFATKSWALDAVSVISMGFLNLNGLVCFKEIEGTDGRGG